MRRPSYPEKRGSSVIIILIFNPLKIHILHLLDMERKIWIEKDMDMERKKDH